jgi:phage FluMu protein Com
MDNRIANCQKCGKVSGPAYFFKGKCPYCGYIQGTQGSSPIAGAAHTNNAYDELTSANARNAELEEALEPFAREAARFVDVPDTVSMDTMGMGGLSVSHLRRAAALLEKK